MTSRRNFLLKAGAAAAASALPSTSFGDSSGRGKISTWVTDSKRRHEPGPAAAWSNAAGTEGGDTIAVEEGQRFQTVLGFGAAFTDASCYLFSRMEPATRERVMSDLFSPERMNLSVGRCCIGSSDYSRDVFSYDDVASDVGMEHFSIAHDREYILPTLRRAREINPGLFLLASPWSPPGWMKVYGSMLGGWMSNQYLAPYAKYLSLFLQEYAKAGVKINAITSQNESETDQEGRMPATYWTPEIERDFVRDHLGPVLRKEHRETQIWLLDHNYNLWKRVKWQMEDPQLRKYVDGVAWHGYVGTPDQMSRLHDIDPELPFYWTEGGPDITDAHYATNWADWGRSFTSIFRNWCRCVIGWNLVLDQRGQPNIGPFTCGGLITIRDDGSVQESGQYWAMRHFSAHVQREATRIATHSDATELDHVAFRNPDGSVVLVLTNAGDARKLAVRRAAESATVSVPANSVVTAAWG